jgi:hypothetical protein
MPTKQKQSKRTHEGYEIVAVPTAWWTVLGLSTTGTEPVWAALFHARSQAEGKRMLATVVDSSDNEEFDNYDDFYLLAPELDHVIPSHVKGQQRQYLEANSEATRSKRASLALNLPTARSTRRGRASSRR